MIPNKRGVVSELNDLPARVLSSQWVADEIRKNTSGTTINQDFKLFLGAEIKPNNAKIFQSVRRFHDHLQRRDIILVPEPVSAGHILIGEVRTPAGIVNITQFARGYGQHNLFSKKVKWLTRIKDQKVTKELMRSLRHENNIAKIRDDFYNEAFSLAYNNFHYNGNYGATIFNTEDDFRNTDAAILGFISNLCAFATQNANSPDGIGGVDLLDIILGNYATEYSSAQSSDIHSEGFTRNLSNMLAPILFSGIVGLFLNLGTCISLDEFNTKINNVEFVDSRAISGKCNPDVHQAAQALFAGMPRHQLYETCRKLAQSDHHTKYRTGSDVVDGGRSIYHKPSANP